MLKLDGDRLPTLRADVSLDRDRATSALRKRIFDLAVTILASVVWIPIGLLCGLAILLIDGRPVLYVSARRVARNVTRPVAKFRTMRRSADKAVNRNTVPVTDVRFLNIPPDSPLYTSIGRWIERLSLTEIPQVFHVLSGDMSLVGNRPLPENVVAELRVAYPFAEDRFVTKTGLTGPVQLVGRTNISDVDRLTIEIEYCRICREAYSMKLDLVVLLYTVYVALQPTRMFSAQQVRELMRRHAAKRLREQNTGRPRKVRRFPEGVL